jgi:hypothetical protein
MISIWSKPTPVRRSAIAAARAGLIGRAAGRASSTTKSLPPKCIFRNGVMAGLDIAPRPVRV